MGLTCRLVAVALAFSLAACQSSSRYVAPQLEPGLAATIVGSDSSAARGARAGLLYIDDKSISAESRTANERLTLAPGPRSLRILINSAAIKMATAETVPFVAEPGESYVIRVADPITISKECARSAIWIEKESGEPVTDRVLITLKVPRYATTIPVAGAFVTIPPRPVNCPG